MKTTRYGNLLINVKFTDSKGKEIKSTAIRRQDPRSAEVLTRAIATWQHPIAVRTINCVKIIPCKDTRNVIKGTTK